MLIYFPKRDSCSSRVTALLPTPPRATRARKRVPTPGSAMATTSGSPFTGKYCPFVSLHWPPKVADQRAFGFLALIFRIRKMEISDKTMLKGNPYLFMYLLNGILPLGFEGKTLLS